MYNSVYLTEIKEAQDWIIEHNSDAKLLNFLRKMENPIYTHGERWSMIFDWMLKHYPEVTGTLVTGITYWIDG